MNDPVNHPKHYTEHPSGVECIQITEHMGFNLGNAVKYIWRADLKGNSIEDLKKARWYIERELLKRGGAIHPSSSRNRENEMSKLTKEQKNFINARLIDYFMTSGNDSSEHKEIKKSLFSYISELIQAAKVKSMAELSYQEVIDLLREHGLSVQICAPSVWKPMRSAPKDGTEIFVFSSISGRDLAKYDAQKKKWVRTWDSSVFKKPELWTDAPEEPNL